MCDEDGQYWLNNVKGKGGKIRNVPVLPDYQNVVVEYCRKAGDRLVWPHVHSSADIHSYRADYAAAWYKQLARPVEELSRSERYDCKKDYAGKHFDKAAMLTVSRYLGHNRINVIAEHYLYSVK